MSIARKLLGIKFENAEIDAFNFISPFVTGAGENGHSKQETILDSVQKIALVDFGGKSALYDFAVESTSLFC